GGGDAARFHGWPGGDSRPRPLPVNPCKGTGRAAARLEQRPSRARQPHMREELHAIAVAPIVISEREEVPALGPAGIVHEDVEPAPGTLNGSNERGGSACIVQVAGLDGRVAAALLDLGRDLAERSLIASVQDEVAALLGEREGDGTPDTAARPGDERDLSAQR